MPKIVDHDQRREEIVEAAWRVIARDGMAHTTTREIAKEAGYSNGVLAHYFADKDALFNHALEVALARATRRIQEWADTHDGIEALRGALLLALPLDRESRLGIEVEVTFWGRAVGDADLCARQLRSLRAWSTALRPLVVGAVAAGDLRADLDVDATVDVLVALVDGLSLEGALYPRRYTKRRLTAVVDGYLSSLR